MDDKPDQAADAATATEAANKVSPITRSFAHRLFHPPKLERKHSSGDLHSRLKTRKILGVGETDNGDVHRSKISQLLGHNEHLYVKFPKGYWIWHLTIAIVFTVVGIMTFLFPDQWYNVVTEEPISEIHLKAMTRYFGSGVIAMALLMWAFLGTIDKLVARSVLAATILIHSLFLFATLLHFWQRQDGICHFCLVTSFCLAAIVSSAYFYWALTTCNPRMRKSASHKELRDSLAKFASTDNSSSNATPKTE